MEEKSFIKNTRKEILLKFIAINLSKIVQDVITKEMIYKRREK